MTKANVLDGLAWAELTEDARVARIASNLIKRYGRGKPTKTEIKDAVRRTKPPYGRGKYVFERVCLEFERQKEIHFERVDAHREFAGWQHNQRQRETRLDNAYAGRFDRPVYLPAQRYSPQDGNWTWDERVEWDERERLRDKGDSCLDISHQGDYMVALLDCYKGGYGPNIAVRHRSGGPTVRTFLRPKDRFNSGPGKLHAAAVKLGGPAVAAAIAKGKRVVTDWVGRRTLIYHDGSDHVRPQVEVLPWLTAAYNDEMGYQEQGLFDHLTITHGDTVVVDERG